MGLLTAEEAYGINLAAQLNTAAVAAGLIIHSHKTFIPLATVAELELPVNELITSGVRVIILAAVGSDVTHVFEAAYRVGAYGPGVTWVGADGTITAELYSSSTEASAAAEGMLGIFPRFDPESPMAVLAYEAVMTNRTWEATLNVSGVVEPFNLWVRTLPFALHAIAMPRC